MSSPASFCDTYGARLGTKKGCKGDCDMLKVDTGALHRPSLRKVCCKFLFLFDSPRGGGGGTDQMDNSSVGFLTVFKAVHFATRYI